MTIPTDGGPHQHHGVHHQIRGNYKTPECNFSGEEIGENWPATCLQYKTDAAIYSLTPEQTLTFASVILRGDALQYCLEHVRDRASSCQEFKQLIQDRFNNPGMQERLKTYIQSLRFDLFTKIGTSPNDALIKLVSVVKQNYAKTPKSWKCEDNKIEVLENAVSGMTWARSPIDRLHVDLKTFEGFYAALANSLQKHLKEMRSARGM